MSIEGLILMGSILAIFVTFSAVLAWGVHQTNSLERDSEKAENGKIVKFAEPASEKHVRAA